jgi:hypothetical protein
MISSFVDLALGQSALTDPDSSEYRSAAAEEATLRHIAIVGARRRTDRDTVDRLIARFPADTVIVSGGASGPDT